MSDPPGVFKAERRTSAATVEPFTEFHSCLRQGRRDGVEPQARPTRAIYQRNRNWPARAISGQRRQPGMHAQTNPRHRDGDG